MMYWKSTNGNLLLRINDTLLATVNIVNSSFPKRADRTTKEWTENVSYTNHPMLQVNWRIQRIILNFPKLYSRCQSKTCKLKQKAY